MTILPSSKLVRIALMINLSFAATALLVRIIFSHFPERPIHPIEFAYTLGWFLLPCAAAVFSDRIARKRGPDWTNQAEKHLLRLPARAAIGLLTAVILTVWAAPNMYIYTGEGTIDTLILLFINLTGLFTGYGIAGWLFRIPNGRWSAMLLSHVILFCLAPVTWILILMPLFLGMRFSGRFIF
jgi:hypothetical protein